MATPEAKVKAIIRAQLESLGPDCYWFTPPGVGLGRSGIHDFVVCYKGHYFGIEAKADNGRVSPHQMREGAALIKAGGRSWVVKGEAQASQVAESLQRTCGPDAWSQMFKDHKAPVVTLASQQ